MSPTNHILSHYDVALNTITSRINTISNDLLNHMEMLEYVFSQSDNDGVNSIIADHDRIHEETRQVISLCFVVLTQFHPLGNDLRLVLTLSRCGDKLQECTKEITNIAKHSKSSIKNHDSLAPDITLPLLEMAVSEYKAAILSLKTQNADASGQIRLSDKKLDKAHRQALALLVSPKRNKESQSLNVHLLFIIRSLERIGDIAKNIAESVVFLKKATDIRHRKKHI